MITGNGDGHSDIMALRSKPRLIVLDESLRIVFADWTAILTLMRVCQNPREPLESLPEPLNGAVRDVIASWDVSSAAEAVVEPIPDVALRVSRLRGESGSYIAVFCENLARRDDIQHAASTFSLTRREQEVLRLVMQGFSTPEIATELTIAETTVSDYFKQLLRKTGAKNRTEMIARVLGWSAHKKE
jgi:DNA-binding CsgD family transcriptional regulator